LLVDVATGDHILEKENFYQATNPEFDNFLFSLQLRYITMEFSPDARYFLASPRVGNPIAFDLSSRSVIVVHGSVKTATANSFVFVTPDEIAGSAGTADLINYLSYSGSFATSTRSCLRLAGRLVLLVRWGMWRAG